MKELVRSSGYDKIKEINQNVPDVLSQLIRTALIPLKGRKFVVADFSAIESRMISWLANEKWKIKTFANWEDIYEELYSLVEDWRKS